MCYFSLRVVDVLMLTGFSLGISLNTLTVSHLLSPCFTRMVTNGLVSSSITLENALGLV